jgi:Rod binding domain-containing protein
MQIDNTLALQNVSIPKITQSNDDEKLKEQTDAFEAFLVKKILDISIKNENSIFGKDSADKIYNSMYNDTMSQALGGGFGFSDILFNYLKEKNN